MAIDLKFRHAAVKTLTREIGCYVLCDLDQVPIYVGQTVDGIRRRVNRHLTSARSDIIANRQIDVWEIAWVWAYPVQKAADIRALECALFYHFHSKSPLMNGKVPKAPKSPKSAKVSKLLESPLDGFVVPEPAQKVQVMAQAEIDEKRDPALRLPRQAQHYSQIVSHFLAVKNSKEIAVAIQAHFDRLSRYHNNLLGLATEIEGDNGSSADR
jgi:hypothetical protein